MAPPDAAYEEAAKEPDLAFDAASQEIAIDFRACSELPFDPDTGGVKALRAIVFPPARHRTTPRPTLKSLRTLPPTDPAWTPPLPKLDAPFSSRLARSPHTPSPPGTLG